MGTVAVFAAFGGRAVAAKYADKPSAPPTWSKDIAPIVYKNCASCHRPGEVAPFALLSYEDARKRSTQLLNVVESKFMPPWKADSNGEFHDERRLSSEEIGTLKKWVAAGSPMGKASEAPKPPVFRSGWHLGKPDREISLPKPFKLEAEGRDVYRCFVIPTDYESDRYLSAIEFAPDNRRVVHHIIAYLDTQGMGRRLDEKDPEPGYNGNGAGPGFLPSGFLGGWAPGNEARPLADGLGILLPKGSDIVLEVHYHKSGKEEIDQSRIGLYFTTKPVEKRVRVMPIINPFFRIPAGASAHEVPAFMPVGQDISGVWIIPHMHMLGKSMKIEAALPDRTVKPLVNIPDWDFNWQLTYTWKEPVKIPRGSTINLRAVYDNSSANPRNPSTPPRDVRWGEQTTDEMCIAFLAYTVDSEQLTKGIEAGVGREIGGRRRLQNRNPGR
jgi:mono/diheme cytochrome c family protein